MNTSPKAATRKRAPSVDATESVAPVQAAPASAEPKPTLAERLPQMSDHQLTAYRASAARIGADPAHPKSAAAIRAQPLIEAEVQRRANAKSAT